MAHNSVWTKNTSLPSFPPLQGTHHTDVLIIGGGMCGLLCAHLLRQQGVDCMVLEKNTIGSGVTQNTTAKLTAQHGLRYASLLKTAGHEKAAMYLQANLAALEQYRAMCQTIACNFEERDAYVYSRKSRKALEDEAAALAALGYKAEVTEAAELPFPAAGAVKFSRQAQFHPLKFLAAIAKDLPVYEHTCVRRLNGLTAHAEQGSVRAKAIIVATHFPFLNTHGAYFLKLYQERSYVIALEQAQPLAGMYIDEAAGGLSFRSYGDLLFVGGGGHRTGKVGGGWAQLRAFAKAHYPRAVERFAWATQDCMSLDRIPYIGPYGGMAPGLFAASGFNKWGMTGSMVAAMVLADLVCGRENPWSPVLSPQRSMLTPQLFINGAETIANLCSFSAKRCPHLGCALKWNKAEHSWDCPCHGSRFDETGRLLNNPATGDIKIE